MINKERENCQYKGGDLVYIISPLTSQLRTNSWKRAIKYVGPVVIYKIVDPHNYSSYLTQTRKIREAANRSRKIWIKEGET